MNANDYIDFSAQITLEGNELVLSYMVNNKSNRDLYLFNRLYRAVPEWKFNSDVIYVHFDSDSRTVWLNKKVPDIPEEILVPMEVVPFVTPVRAGSMFQEEVRIPLPLREQREYPDPKKLGVERVANEKPVASNYQKIYFTLGYYWRIEGAGEEIRDVHGTEVVFPLPPEHYVLPETGELQTDLQQLVIPVVEF